MEDQHALQIGLDFADSQTEHDVRNVLEFAEQQLAADLAQADVVIGDGGKRASAGATPYVVCHDAGNASRAPKDGLSLRLPLRLHSLLAVLAQVHRTDGDVLPSAAASRYVGESEAAINTRLLIDRAANRDITVLITGESGTGKEVVARALHDASPRASGPFVPINCGAIPSELLESELFGHERGAFTGAIAQKIGRFELANGGTLFLDEIGDMPYPMQVKLLRALEERSFERIGGTSPIQCDVRIVAATNQNLETQMQAGEFREDLYYRLNVFPIELLPLSSRSEDIPVLINALIGRIYEEQRLGVRFSQDALECLQRYAWPGNVRELANVLQRLAIQFPNGLVTQSELPKKIHGKAPAVKATSTSADNAEVLLPVNGIDLKGYLTRLERSLIEQALEDANAVVARAADKLNIRRTTLVEKMRKHGLGRVAGDVQ